MREPGDKDSGQRKEYGSLIAQPDESKRQVHDGRTDHMLDKVHSIVSQDSHPLLRVVHHVELPEQRNLVTDEVCEPHAEIGR